MKFKLISEFKKSYSGNDENEINEGILFSKCGFVFPIINGIPRMLIESIYDYDYFLKKHLLEYDEYKDRMEKEFPGLLNYCRQKNKKSKISFGLEWSFLNKEKNDKIWHEDLSDLPKVFELETGENLSYFNDKVIIDVGSGHGLMTSTIAQFSKYAIGVEMTNAVENAFKINKNKNAFYVQGDLQFLPFNELTFDVLYSSGVIHHTNNTELSLSLIESTLKHGGKICVWLYHPQKNLIHNLSLTLRKITSRLPVRITLIFLVISIFPFSFLIKKIKNKNPPNYREEIIDLLDGFTPQFRFEIPHDMAKAWLIIRNYNNIKITSSNQYGFSIAGEKRSDF
ncbi:MAG: class I SAM-dependent methyltransferase [Ginsengibacter sp.]